MNLSWSLFSVGDTALGGWGANLFRIMTIAFSIVFTIAIKKQQTADVSFNSTSESKKPMTTL